MSRDTSDNETSQEESSEQEQDSDVFGDIQNDSDPEQVAADKFGPLDKESREVLRVSKYIFALYIFTILY